MSTPSWLEVGVPTLERPFGVKLWPIFSAAFEAVKGYKPEEFRFEQGVMPMSTLGVTVTMLVSYYIIIFGGREVMRKREALQLSFLFKVHNLLLTFISGSLLGLFVEQLLPMVVNKGVFYGICDVEGGWTDELVILYYLNYLTKYLELIDTCFLFLKKKPLNSAFLHTYHHGATALLCYTQLIGHTPVSWVVITLNLMVHVVMYWYYFQAARGIRIWWKQYITVMQIIQFVVDLGFVYFASWTYFTSTYFPWLPNMGKCAGEEFAAIAGIAILSSYLLLFISFYLATYKKPVKKGRGRARSALIEMKDEKVPGVVEIQEKAQQTPLAQSSGNSLPSNESRYATRSRKA
ncbi:GNS1/SUR4 membrane protein [Aulographum hederae CBS 113979]|uniref:Elongation of fatty acids protein n=1 Tax=Aulographum hederae CBS 113979 TaxID=1176131 RepID=A0A6G1HDQ2_9PEZI|nr:GNS1/SUR4 membrane protein [Aulographum hederae CBS 113979]